jgi:hypothetical protein
MTKKEREQQEAVDTLKQWGVVDGTTVYAKVNKVSSSGMSRNIGLYIAKVWPKEKGGELQVVDISYHAARALGWPYKDGYAGGVRVSGCGMDMLFHTVSSLSYAMGYGSLCQKHDQTEPEEKKGINGQTITAIGLKYRQL